MAVLAINALMDGGVRAIDIVEHALERMNERGVTAQDVAATIHHGEQFPAKRGRTGFRRNFPFDAQ